MAMSAAAAHERAGLAPPPRKRPYVLRTEPDGLYALLSVPKTPRGLVVFVHDDFPFSPTDYRIATFLQAANFATLMVDFFTTEEDEDMSDVFDVDTVARRLDGITGWAAGLHEFCNLPFAYFATGMGAAAAVISAAHNQSAIGAMCLLARRPQLTYDALKDVQAPTLLMAASSDHSAATFAQCTAQSLECPRKLVFLTDAGDGIPRVARHSRQWFSRHLS